MSSFLGLRDARENPRTRSQFSSLGSELELSAFTLLDP